MGGSSERFHTTCWTRIRSLKSLEQADRQQVAEDLIQQYWKPVYCYLRHKGHPNETAKDLTQDFFISVVLGRNLMEQADQHRGRFRTFLLTALDRYVIDIHRKQTAGKRAPISCQNHPELSECLDLPIDTNRAGPEHAFHYAWAASLLDEVLKDLERTCLAGDKATHWQVFRARVLDPIMTGRAPANLETLCQQYHIESQVRASNMIITIKRRFRAMLEDRLRQSLDTDTDLEQELHEMIEILSNPCAETQCD